SAELEGLEEEAELLLRVLLRDPHDAEDALLHLTGVDADRAAADLVAVADDVVRVRERLPRILVEGVEELGLGRREGVVDRGPRALTHRDVASGLRVRGRLEERRVDNPHERPLRLVEEALADGDLLAGRAQEAAGRGDVRGREEDRIAGGGACRLEETGPLLLRQVLRDWSGQLAVRLDEDVGEALRAPLLRPLLPAVQLTTGQLRAAGVDDGAHVGSAEHAERRVPEVVRELDELEVEAQVRLVRAVPGHGLAVRHPADGPLDVDIDELPQRREDLLRQRDDVVLLD